MGKTNRRYYWLKLKEDFFVDIRMKRLRKLSGGNTYTIIYLKLLLLSLRDERRLYFERVDENFVKELALVTDETEDDIQVTLRYLQSVGLLEIISEDEYFLTELPTLIGSETDWAVKKRKYREQRKQLTERTMSSPCPTNVRQEIEKDIDIEIEKKREGEIEKEKITPTPSLYGQFNNVSLSDEEYKKLEKQLKDHTKTMIEKLSRYMKSTGKDYDNHYATILSWYEEDKDKLTQNRSNKNQIYNYDDSPSI